MTTSRQKDYLNLVIYYNYEKKIHYAILNCNQKTHEEKLDISNAFQAASSRKALIQKIDKFIADQPKIKGIYVANAILAHGNVEYVDLIKIGENYYTLDLAQHNEDLSEEVFKEPAFAKIDFLKRQKDIIFAEIAKYEEMLEILAQDTRELLKSNNRFEQYKLKK